ncbi:MAG: hypothetical protein Q7T33_09165 [Dehalococcoidia bacterium]|nr:hypothetical protein [Dehalococcoidia bacterium]
MGQIETVIGEPWDPQAETAEDTAREALRKRWAALTTDPAETAEEAEIWEAWLAQEEASAGEASADAEARTVLMAAEARVARLARSCPTSAT